VSIGCVHGTIKCQVRLGIEIFACKSLCVLQVFRAGLLSTSAVASSWWALGLILGLLGAFMLCPGDLVHHALLGLITLCIVAAVFVAYVLGGLWLCWVGGGEWVWGV
jgi:hypothetical protein